MTVQATSALTRMKTASKAWADTMGVPVIWADQDGMRPASPYATLRLSSLERVHEDAVQSPDTTGHAHISGSREAVLTVQVYGTRALELANRLSLSAHMPQPAMDDLGVCIVDVRQFSDVSKLITDSIEPRVVLDVVLRASSDVTDTVGLVEHVESTSTVGDVAGTLTIN